jgi:hypothetical protein
MHAVLERMERRCVLKGTHAKFPLAEAAKTRDLNMPQELETIDPRPQEPWREPFIERIDLEGDKEKTIDKINRIANDRHRIIYAAAMENKKQLGAGVVELNHRNEATRSQRTSIGNKSTWSNHLAQLIAISKAVEAIETISNEENSIAFTIVSDSRTALQTVANMPNKSGQQIVKKILDKIKELHEQGIRVSLLLAPKGSHILGTDLAKDVAKEAAGPDEQHTFRRPLTTQKKHNKDRMLLEWRQDWQSAKNTKHLRRIDKNLPSKHTLRLYGSRQRNRAYILHQLRTGQSWLAEHGKIRGFREDDKCECGARETVVHVLVDCPHLQQLRQELRRKIGDAFNNISTMLGGKPHDEQRRKRWVVNTDVLNAVLDLAEDSQRFQSRQEVGSQARDRRQGTRRRP